MRSVWKPQAWFIWACTTPEHLQVWPQWARTADLSAAHAAGFTVKGHHFDSGPSFFAGLSGKFALLADSLSPAWHHGGPVAGLPATWQICISARKARSVSCALC